MAGASWPLDVITKYVRANYALKRGEGWWGRGRESHSRRVGGVRPVQNRSGGERGGAITGCTVAMTTIIINRSSSVVLFCSL